MLPCLTVYGNSKPDPLRCPLIPAALQRRSIASRCAVLLAILSLFFLAFPSAVRAQDAPVRDTFSFGPMTFHGAPIVEVKVNHRYVARFMLDTGSSVCAVTTAFVKELKLKTLKAPQTTHKPGEQFVMIDHFALDKIESEGEFYVLGGAIDYGLTHLGVDGLLGMNFLMNTALVLDFSRQECTVYYPGNLSPALLTGLGFDPGKTVAVPLLGSSNGVYRILLSLNGKKVETALDSGARRTVFPITQLPAQAKVIANVSAIGAEGMLSADIVCGNQVVVGDAILSDYPVGFGKTSTGVVGMDVLSQLRLVFDFPAKKMYAARSAEPYNPTWVQNQTRPVEDMAIVHGKDKKWRVASIESIESIDDKDGKGTFSKAGLKQGDQLIAVDGASITAEYPEALVDTLTKRKAYTLTVLRGANRDKVTCQVHRP